MTVTLPVSLSSNYQVYAYFDAITNNGAVVAGYSIGGQTYWTQDTASFAGTYVPATGTTEAAATQGSNYAHFTGLSGTSFTLTLTPGGIVPPSPDTNFRAELMGIQIVTPEPTSVAILGVGALGILKRTRRPA